MALLDSNGKPYPKPAAASYPGLLVNYVQTHTARTNKNYGVDEQVIKHGGLITETDEPYMVIYDFGPLATVTYADIRGFGRGAGLTRYGDTPAILQRVEIDFPDGVRMSDNRYYSVTDGSYLGSNVGTNIFRPSYICQKCNQPRAITSCSSCSTRLCFYCIASMEENTSRNGQKYMYVQCSEGCYGRVSQDD